MPVKGTTEGFTLSSRQLGHGPLVVMVHGMAASGYDWEALMPTLAEAGFRSVAVDLLGHGDSAKPLSVESYLYPNFYATFESWLDSQTQSEPGVLIGHSLGGHLSLKYSLRRPERVRALVLINPLYSLRQLSPVLRLLHRRPTWGARAVQLVPLAVIDRVLAWDPINLAGFPLEARHQIALDYKRASPLIFYLTPTIPDLTNELRHLQQPTLTIWGGRDLTLDPASFPRLVAQIKAGRGYTLPRSGHQPHIGEPQQVNRLVLDFLQNLPVGDRWGLQRAKAREESGVKWIGGTDAG